MSETFSEPKLRYPTYLHTWRLMSPTKHPPTPTMNSHLISCRPTETDRDHYCLVWGGNACCVMHLHFCRIILNHFNISFLTEGQPCFLSSCNGRSSTDKLSRRNMSAIQFSMQRRPLLFTQCNTNRQIHAVDTGSRVTSKYLFRYTLSV